MLRVAEQAHRTDTGRQRSANEDAYFARAPVFAVADGMGGAQAGEVASRIAAEAFEPGNERGEPPEAYLRRVAQEANERIHALSRQDASRSGMGTTLTAALIEADEVSLAHVGDSRAYVLRDGALSRLTSDHSLVEELRRQGRLTERQAEEHPQRSIITRALGPEPQVQVDTVTCPARPGDVFLLCSDGLTTMLPEQRIADVLGQEPSLEAAALRLVREANEAGGRDNVTVVAFRLEAEGEPAEPAAEGATLIGPAAEAEGLTAEAVRAGAARRGPSRAGAPGGRPARAARPAPWRRVALAALLTIALGGIAAGAVLGARQVHFLGVDEAGRLALYRGLPYELPFGIELYSEQYSVGVQAGSVPDERRGSLTDHELRSREDAVSLLADLERAALAAPPAAGEHEASGRPRRRGKRAALAPPPSAEPRRPERVKREERGAGR